MDLVMPAAIAAACVVAHAYGVAPAVPARPLPGRLDFLATLIHQFTAEPSEEFETMVRVSSGLPLIPQPLIVACLPSRIRDRLIGLAYAMAGHTAPVHLTIVTVIFLIGAIAVETFEPLNFLEPGSGQ
jgi:hypothetical protein